MRSRPIEWRFRTGHLIFAIPTGVPLPEQAVVVSAIFEGKPSDPKIITVEMDLIARAREETQPLRTKTGGSTFKPRRI